MEYRAAATQTEIVVYKMRKAAEVLKRKWLTKRQVALQLKRHSKPSPVNISRFESLTSKPWILPIK